MVRAPASRRLTEIAGGYGVSSLLIGIFVAAAGAATAIQAAAMPSEPVTAGRVAALLLVGGGIVLIRA